MKFTYTVLCITLLSIGAYAGETVRAPKIATHPSPPVSTRCPPAAATQLPPAAATRPPARHMADRAPPVERNQDEKFIPGRPMEPKPVDQPPPPPCT